jgi:hypothetical protein
MTSIPLGSPYASAEAGELLLVRLVVTQDQSPGADDRGVAVASGKSTPRREFQVRYSSEFMTALRTIATPRRQANVLQHMLCFGVNASQSLAAWRRSGWIHPQDPRGWFQWYCRYYLGRRSADDVRQIRRWRAIGRHVAAIRKNCEPGDLECRRKQRQAVLHWAYDSRRI